MSSENSVNTAFPKLSNKDGVLLRPDLELDFVPDGTEEHYRTPLHMAASVSKVGLVWAHGRVDLTVLTCA